MIDYSSTRKFLLVSYLYTLEQLLVNTRCRLRGIARPPVSVVLEESRCSPFAQTPVGHGLVILGLLNQHC